jgi:hypothetical protein
MTLHFEELNNFHTTPDVTIIGLRNIRILGDVICMGNACKILTGKSKGKRSLARPRHRREDTIKTNLEDIVLEVVGCICLAQHKDTWQPVLKAELNFEPHEI